MYWLIMSVSNYAAALCCLLVLSQLLVFVFILLNFLSLCLGIREELFLHERLELFPEKNGEQLRKSHRQD